MANCPECGTPIPEGQEKCPACGEIPMNLSTTTAAHINLLKKKLEKEPTDAKLLIELGDLYYKHKFPREALNHYQKAAKAHVSNYDAQIKSAHLFLRFRELDNSEHAFRTALHINPKSSEALIGLFRTYYLADRTTEAIVLGEKIIQSKPDSVEFHMLLKNLYSRKGDKEKTLQELLELVSLVPNNEQVVKELAALYKNENNMEKLAEYYHKMLDMNIEDVELGVHIVKHYFEKHTYDKVIEHASLLLQKESVTPEIDTIVRTYLAQAHFIKGNISEAKHFADTINPAPAQDLDETSRKSLASLYYDIGQKELEKGKAKKAIACFEKAVLFDEETLEYKQLLEKTRTDVSISTQQLFHKIGIIGGSALGACIVIIVAWLLVRNRIILHVDPFDEVIVLIDGKLVEPSPDEPAVVKSPILFIGSHTVEIDKAGYETWQRSVNIGIGRPTKLDVKLVPLFFFLQVTSIPESASVLIDGEVVGKTPFMSDEITAAPHIIEVLYTGYNTWKHELTDMMSDSIDLGIITLRNLAGTWRGQIGEDSYAYKAAFSMTIEQIGEKLSIKYYHTPRENHRYSGKISGNVKDGNFFATGNVTYRYLKVFYWAEEKQKITMQGKMSDNWLRIEGKHSIGSFAEKDWWAEYRPE